jgi:hypothetical protein
MSNKKLVVITTPAEKNIMFDSLLKLEGRAVGFLLHI